MSIFIKLFFPLNVMVWKLMKLRISRYWTTLFELFQGCLLFLALFLAKESILTPEKSERILDPHSITKIFYMPHNNFTGMLMNNVVSELTNNPVNVAGISQNNNMWKLSRRFVIYDDEQPSNIFDNNVVIVNIMTQAENTNNFTYHINMYNITTPKDKNENIFKGIFHRSSPQEEVIHPLLGSIQWAIDKTYMQLLLNQTVTDLSVRQKTRFIVKDLERLHKFIILCMIMAPLPYFIYKSTEVIVSRRTGFRDLIKLSGVTSGVYRNAHLIDAAVMGTIYAVIITFFLKITSQPILPYTNCLIIVITIILYFINVTALALIISTLAWNIQHATSIAFLVYVCSFLLDSMWHSVGITTEALRQALCCLLPHAPMYMFWTEVTYLEVLVMLSFAVCQLFVRITPMSVQVTQNTDPCVDSTSSEGANFSNIYTMHSRLSVMETWLFSCVQLIVLTVLDWYVDTVKPGKFGMPQKWNFMFQKKFLMRKKKKRVNFHVTAELHKSDVSRDERHFESGPPNAEIAVKISNVSKVFKYNTDTHRLLDEVNLDVYRGEVTVLLGQTGSGKSVLMSIIAGLYAASKGTVYINGLDNVQRIHDVLDIVALCPQENIIHRHLTVKENLIFFEKLTKKGTSKRVDELMLQLNMTDKAHFHHSELSKGLRRCLQVACALVSDSDVLILDEPTSGMNYEARHRLWDLIMDLRGEKTIIMTTSYLEEAEALGDRIAILSKGFLRCYGSPAFLKQAIGGGFNLTISLKKDVFMGQLYKLVDRTIPNIKCKQYDKYTISFILPIKEHDLFPKLFDTLEHRSVSLTITAIDVGWIMEDIYLKFIDEMDDDDIDLPATERELDPERLKGYPLILQQFKLLIKRNYHYLWLKKYQFIIVQVLVPIIGLLIITLTTNRCLGFGNLFQTNINTRKLLHNMGLHRSGGLNGVIDMNGIEPVFSKDVERDLNKPYLLSDTTDPAIGIIMYENKSRLIVSDPSEVPIGINIFSNMYLHLHAPYNSKRIITTYKTILRSPNVIIEPKDWFLCVKWSICVVFCEYLVSIVNLTPSIILSIIELRSGSRATHNMAGCSLLVHWGSKLLADFLIYMAVIPVSVVLSALILDFDRTFNNVEFLGFVCLLLILFALAFLAHLYFLSFISSKNQAITQVLIMSLGFGIVIPIFLYVFKFLWDQYTWLILLHRIIAILAYLSPMYPFCLGIMHLATQSRMNAFCNLNRDQCPDLVIESEQFSTDTCCESSSTAPFSYMDAAESLYVLFLVLQFIVYSILVIMLEKRVIQTTLERIAHFNYLKPEQEIDSPEVNQERDVVKDMVGTKQFSKSVFVAYDIHKSFRHFGVMKQKGKLNAVAGISLKAQEGECIGILGPDMSGKTTLLKMLCGDIVMTRGNSWIEGYSIKKERSKYIKRVGRAGLDQFLTGLENLILIKQLQGLSLNKAESSSFFALRYLGLKSFQDIQVMEYNAAYYTRLELAMVYTLAPVVAFINEPMLSADPMTEHVIIRALQLLIAGSTTVITTMTSVSRRNVESLYSRLAIILKGQLAALGPASEVISKLTLGYMVRIKLNVVTSYKISLAVERPSLIDMKEAKRNLSSIAFSKGVDDLKDDFKRLFTTSSIIEEHVCLLKFYIEDDNKTMLYSDMFSKLQSLKLKYETLIAYYTLSAATVRDTFKRIKQGTAKI